MSNYEIMMKFLFILNLTLSGAVSLEAHKTRPSQDINGGAASIFKRPENPPIQARGGATASKQRSSVDNVRDEVEDAITLGNAARDRKPPDFQSAERAYRLALKLNPRDPRPYLGLGNLYWDQRRYPEAASSYRDAVRKMTRNNPLLSAALVGFGLSKARKSAFEPDQARLYLAAALLQELNPLSAERELRTIAFSHLNNAEWNALFGYALASQGRYTEAVTAFEKAVKLEPLNEKYQELLKETTQKARETSAKDQEITSRLQNTTWEVQDPSSSVRKATCHLDPNGSVRCRNIRSGLALSNATWRIRDGIVGFEGTSKVRFCLGQLRIAMIDVKCYNNDNEINELWKMQR